MVNFDDRLDRSPSEEPRGTLFGAAVRMSPEAKKMIEHEIGLLAGIVITRGGRLNIVTEGPEQGITVEVGGKTVRLAPSSKGDPEEAAISRYEFRAMGERGITDPLAMRIATLRTLLIADSELK